MKVSELRDHSVDELKSREGDLRRELWKARFDNYTNQLDDTAKVRRLRREIAQVKTIIAEMERGARGGSAQRGAEDNG